ncbi:SAV_2336 N-terminal domain-related protein [Streptomyces sp. NPDC057638]|uniref:SAV_2336 N-terminal domain-related protein n=1 Tax=Streptomyces sp. NPDC057638 TaxID=3346190 RepID=UPI0036AF5825
MPPGAVPEPEPPGAPTPPAPPGRPGPSAAFDRGVLTAFVARLREADLTPSAEEVADALWLARHVPAADTRSLGTSPSVPAAGERSGGPGGGVAPEPIPPRLPRPAGGPLTRPRVALYGPAQPPTADGGRESGSVSPVTVPAPAVLPDTPALERSLRPLQRYRPPMRLVRSELDEIATADRAADTGLVLPVLLPVRRREARLALVMDDSSSNIVWEAALDELRQICERAGAFREITVHRVGDDRTAAPPGDPTGRRLTLVLSDCAGPLWRSGTMQRLLHTWGSTAPVAVVQPLPQRMWGRTHLPARAGLLRRREGPAGRLEFSPHRGPATGRGLPVPVLAPRRSSFEAWTRLIAGATGQSLQAAAATVFRHHRPATERPRAERPLAPVERVRLFRRTASPAAAQLAVYLSAVPLLLPVMRLVQRAMLVRSGPDVLAEVLLGGLLRRDDPDPTRTGQEPSYTFLDGVREELLGQLGAGSATLVLKHCSEYVESRYGRTARNFPALAAAFLTGAVDPRAESQPAQESGPLLAFAQVSSQVLRRFGAPPPAITHGAPPKDGPGGLAAQARACLDHFGEHGTVRDLDTAVRLLSAATQTERRTTARAGLYEELAEALLRRWLVRPLPEDLPEALEAAQNAISGGPPKAQLTLARVLELMADEVAAGRLHPKLVPEWAGLQAADGAGGENTAGPVAAVLLAAAESSLADLTDGPPGQRHPFGDGDDTVPPGGPLRDTAAVARVRVLRRLAVLGAAHPPSGSPAPWFTSTLRTALDVLQPLADVFGEPVPEALADLRPGGHRAPSESALLTRGGILLDLARHHRGEGVVPPVAVDPAASRAYAQRAGDDLHAGIDAMDWGAVDPGELQRAWLDYADAIEFSDEDPDDDTRLRILQALDQARRNVGDDEETHAHILLRMARLLEQRYAATGSWAHRDSAIAAWAEALPLLPPGHPERAGVLTSLGRQLTERGVDKDAPGDVHLAVRALRGAIDGTPTAHPELPGRRALLGQAYLERFRAEGALADLHEADWTLGAAARDADDPELAAYAWWHRSLTSALLARRTTDRGRLRSAVGYLREAERGAEELLEGAVTAQWERAGRLERTAGPERALEELRAVLSLLDAVGVGPVELIRREVTRLERTR